MTSDLRTSDLGTSDIGTPRRLPPALLCVSPGVLSGAADARDFVARVGAATAGGVRGLMLREPLLDDRDYLELAAALRTLLNPAEGGWLCVHDRLHLVRTAGADAGYAAGRSLPSVEARRVVGPDVTLGAAVHAGDPDPEEADFVCFAPVFAPHSKDLEPGSEAAGLAGLMARLEVSRAPTWAMGGMDPSRIAQLAAPVKGAAVIGSLWGHPDHPLDLRGVESAARDLALAARGAFG